MTPAGRETAGLRALTPAVPALLAGERPRVTVLGDLMLDGWWTGEVHRLCREAPAPVVDLAARSYTPGGAGNTAMNLAAMGAEVRVIGCVGDDDNGRLLRGLLAEAGVDVQDVVLVAGHTTQTKCRVVSGGQVLLRIDDGGGPVPAPVQDQLAEAALRAVDGADAFLVCDYGSGALPTQLAGQLRATAQGADGQAVAAQGATAQGADGQRADGQAAAAHPADRHVPVFVVDAHDARLWAELQPDVVTPNAQEAAAMLNALMPPRQRAQWVLDHGAELLAASGAGAAVVTLDTEGTQLVGGTPPGPSGRLHRTWTRPAEDKQASGAGDTFVAALTLCLACDVPMSTAMDFAQTAADIVVRRFGTSVCSTEDLAVSLGQSAERILSADELARRLARARQEGQRVVLTNGCFDVLHRGHTTYLNQARQLGDLLVVAVNGDESTRRLKGEGRPINPALDRAGVLASLSCVDFVTVFETDTPIPLLELLEPEVYAKGGDYTAQMLAETAAVEAYGGRVEILDYVANHSTTAMVERITGRVAAGPGQGTP
jgi:D-beta-D-heptose 7-phosphate kinase / D-beta-D-heptose 1-phosphate adenosyltransferase